MTRAAATARHVLVWLTRICLWIVVGSLAIALLELAYFGAGNESLFGCFPRDDVLFYFACNGQTPKPILEFLLNLPVLFVYAAASTVLGLPPGRMFVLLFYLFDVILVLAVLRLTYLLYAGARRLAGKQ